MGEMTTQEHLIAVVQTMSQIDDLLNVERLVLPPGLSEKREGFQGFASRRAGLRQLSAPAPPLPATYLKSPPHEDQGRRHRMAPLSRLGPVRARMLDPAAIP